MRLPSRLVWWTDNNLANLLWIQTSLLWVWPAVRHRFVLAKIVSLPSRHTHTTEDDIILMQTIRLCYFHPLPDRAHKCAAFKLSFIYYSCLDVINGIAFEGLRMKMVIKEDRMMTENMQYQLRSLKSKWGCFAQMGKTLKSECSGDNLECESIRSWIKPFREWSARA